MKSWWRTDEELSPPPCLVARQSPVSPPGQTATCSPPWSGQTTSPSSPWSGIQGGVHQDNYFHEPIRTAAVTCSPGHTPLSHSLVFSPLPSRLDWTSWQLHLGNTACPCDHVPLLPCLGAYDPKVNARAVIFEVYLRWYFLAIAPKLYVITKYTPISEKISVPNCWAFEESWYSVYIYFTHNEFVFWFKYGPKIKLVI